MSSPAGRAAHPHASFTSVLALLVATTLGACADEPAPGWCEAAGGRDLLTLSRRSENGRFRIDLLRFGISDAGAACTATLATVWQDTLRSPKFAVSPDGRRVVLQEPFTDDGMAHAVYMIDLEGNSPTTAVLSSHASIPDAPWSPDGSWLVFTQWSDTVDAPVQLRAIRAEATSEDFPTAVDLGAPADLVFDEHSLWQPHGNALQLWAVTARQMVLHDLDSGTQAQWDVPSSFWSPDGRWLLSVVHDDTTQTWTTSVIDTTKPGVAPIVLFPGQSISGGTWSTDGRFLAVSVPEPRELVVLDMSSGSPQVTATRFPDLQPGSWLDSTWMLSDASSGPAFVNLDGTLIPIPEGASRVSPVPGRVAVTFRGNQGQKYLTPQGTSVPITRCNDVEEAWAPDGAHVVCWPDPKAAALYDIDAVTRTTLTLGPIGNFGRATSMQAFWSPDGARVVFSAAGSLAVADAVTGEIHEIVPPAPGEVLNVVWRPMR